MSNKYHKNAKSDLQFYNNITPILFRKRKTNKFLYSKFIFVSSIKKY